MEGKNLSGLDLAGVNFNGINMKSVNFSRADLSGANFRNANLNKANLVLSQLGFGNCLRKRLRLLTFFRSVDVGGWQPWDENGMWSGWKGKNETSWND